MDKNNAEADHDSSDFILARRPTFLTINLDVLIDNVKILRGFISQNTDIISVVKDNAYGHGSVAVAKHLEKKCGIHHFAVATALEGEELRTGGVQGSIQVLGNAAEEDIATLYTNRLTPTVATIPFLAAWRDYWIEKQRVDEANQVNDGACLMEKANVMGYVVIKIDSGMGRNGCQPEQLPDIVTFCEEKGVPIHTLMTHFAAPWDDHEFTQKQMDCFMKAVRPYRERGMRLQAAASGAVANKLGVDFDFVRVGKSIIGRAPEHSEVAIAFTKKTGYKTGISWKARATLVKKVKAGHPVGYEHAYTCKEDETIATLPVGYGDCYRLSMAKDRYVTTAKGIKCPVVGESSMDAITVKLPAEAEDERVFYLIRPHSDAEIDRPTDEWSPITFPGFNIDRRVPRLYVRDGVTSTDT